MAGVGRPAVLDQRRYPPSVHHVFPSSSVGCTIGGECLGAAFALRFPSPCSYYPSDRDRILGVASLPWGGSSSSGFYKLGRCEVGIGAFHGVLAWFYASDQGVCEGVCRVWSLAPFVQVGMCMGGVPAMDAGPLCACRSGERGGVFGIAIYIIYRMGCYCLAESEEGGGEPLRSGSRWFRWLRVCDLGVG